MSESDVELEPGWLNRTTASVRLEAPIIAWVTSYPPTEQLKAVNSLIATFPKRIDEVPQ